MTELLRAKRMAPSTPERASAEASAVAGACRSYLESLDERASALSELSGAFVPFLDAAGGGGSGSGQGDPTAAKRYREAAEAAAAALKASAPVAAELLASLRRAGLVNAGGGDPASPSAASAAVPAVEAAEAAQREALRLTVVLHGLRKAATEGLKRRGEGGAGRGGHSCGWHRCGHHRESDEIDDGLQQARLRSEREGALAEATAALQEVATTIGEARTEIAEAAAAFEEMA